MIGNLRSKFCLADQSCWEPLNTGSSVSFRHLSYSYKTRKGDKKIWRTLLVFFQWPLWNYAIFMYCYALKSVLVYEVKNCKTEAAHSAYKCISFIVCPHLWSLILCVKSCNWKREIIKSFGFFLGKFSFKK